MPLFFFHIRNSREVIQDFEGTELPGAKAALEEAKAAAREILASRMRQGEVIDGQEFEVWDETGTRIFNLPFKSVLKLE